MLDDIVGGAVRIVGQFFVEIVIEVLIKGPGYFLVKLISKSQPDPDGVYVLIVGFLFWIVVGYIVYFNYSMLFPLEPR